MADLNQEQQRELVRDRFTRTAEVFGSAVMQTRAVEAEILAEMVACEEKRLRGGPRERHGSSRAGVRAACPLDYRLGLDAGDARRGAASCA